MSPKCLCIIALIFLPALITCQCDPSTIEWCISGSFVATLFNGDYGYRGTHNGRRYYRLCGNEYLYWDPTSNFWALSDHKDDTSPMAYCKSDRLSACTAGEWVSGTHTAAETLTITSGQCPTDHESEDSPVLTPTAEPILGVKSHESVPADEESTASDIGIYILIAIIVILVVLIGLICLRRASATHVKRQNAQPVRRVVPMHVAQAGAPGQNQSIPLSTDHAPTNKAIATDSGDGANYNYVAPSAPMNVPKDPERKEPVPLSTDQDPNSEAYAAKMQHGADYNDVAPSAPYEHQRYDGDINGESGVEGLANAGNNDAHTAIKQWFNTSVNLTADNERYFRMFVAYGYDDMSLVKEITETELIEMGITKLAHKKRILSAIRNI
eukprot:1023785_1